jgi:hypothetical protein
MVLAYSASASLLTELAPAIQKNPNYAGELRPKNWTLKQGILDNIHRFR